MQFNFMIFGYGFGIAIGMYDINYDLRIILNWSIVRNYQVWRAEYHSRTGGSYLYECIKNGKTVEKLSFQSPVLDHLR